MLRLWARLSAEGGPALARFALAYIGDEVRQALMKRRPLVLVVRGRRAVLVKATDAAAKDAAVVVPLPALLEGVSEAVQELREERPEVWAGLGWLSPADALQEALV